MSNYRIKIQYDGSRYRGWQRQQGEKNTIQGRIEQVLSKQMEFPVTIDGAGRTDAGVHAKEQVANFRLNTEKTTQQLQDVLNEYLPEDIRILKVEEAGLWGIWQKVHVADGQRIGCHADETGGGKACRRARF